MSNSMSRRAFAVLSGGIVLGASSAKVLGQDLPKDSKEAAAQGKKTSEVKSTSSKPGAAKTPRVAVEAPFNRDYPEPSFKPAWRKQQINRLMVQDFVIYAHSELPMVKKLLAKEPMLINATMDWGGGDWESGLGGASHMGRQDIVEFLLANGARIDIFCAAMLGHLDAVKQFLTMQPKLIDAKGPHGFTLHFHAQVGGKNSAPVLDYLQSIKKIELKTPPFMNKGTKPPAKKENAKSK